MSYAKRKLDVTVKLGKGSFGFTGTDTVKVSGLRVVATVVKQGLPGFDTAEILIYGMPLDLMNQLSTTGVPLPMSRDNTVLLEAGDDENGMATVFQGTLQNAWVDLQSQPDAIFNIIATPMLGAMVPAPPTSYQGSADVATIMSGLARLMVPPLAFENSGVSVVLSNPYLPGSPRKQAEALARAADINMTIDGDTLAIWPKNGSRHGQLPLINKDTGLVTYPRYTELGIGLRTLYNPSLRFGGTIKVQSAITPANGIWTINKLSYQLSSELPNGPWFADLEAFRFGQDATIPR